jgi:hypothetical protein
MRLRVKLAKSFNSKSSSRGRVGGKIDEDNKSLNLKLPQRSKD